MIHGRGGLKFQTRPTKLKIAAGLAVLLFAGMTSYTSAQVGSSEDNSLTSVYRMNAGGPDFVDVFGQEWQGDTGAVGGENTATTENVDGAWDQQLFREQRKGMTRYQVDGFSGPHVMRLYFAATAADEGPFTVSVGSATLVDNYDPAAEVGLLTPDVKQFTVNVPETGFDLTFTGTKPSLAGIELLAVTNEPKKQPGWGTLVDLKIPGLNNGSTPKAMPSSITPIDSSGTPTTATTAPPELGVSSDWASEQEILGTTAPAATGETVQDMKGDEGDSARATTTDATEPALVDNTPAAEAESVYRMTGAASPVVTDDGKTWRADAGTGGTLETVNETGFRVSPESYVLPMQNGAYTLELTFVAAEGTFSVTAEGQTMATDLDGAAQGESFAVAGNLMLADGVLDLEFTGDAALASIELMKADPDVTTTNPITDVSKPAPTAPATPEPTTTPPAPTTPAAPAPSATDGTDPFGNEPASDWIPIDQLTGTTSPGTQTAPPPVEPVPISPVQS